VWVILGLFEAPCMFTYVVTGRWCSVEVDEACPGQQAAGGPCYISRVKRASFRARREMSLWPGNNLCGSQKRGGGGPDAAETN
jgi:hypothetical protein